MTEDFAITLAILIAGYIFVTPFVLIVLFVKQRKRIHGLEEDVEFLIQQINRVEHATVKAARKEPEPVPAVEPIIPPVEEPSPIVEEKPPTGMTVSPPPVKQAPMEPVEMPVSEQPVDEPLDKEPVWSMTDRIQGFLKGIGMWPPSSDSGHDRETALMQWWLPRIGGLLALLSALFFGVYINQNTSPFFKCLELAAVSLALIALGRYMERKYRTFGGVVLVTGLIMLYMTSVAAYVLPATRIVEDPLLGSLMQAAVLLLICVVGLLRRSSGIVLLAFHFGFFLCIFMAWEGLREGALITSGLLFFAGVILSRKPLFQNLILVTIPGSFLVVLAFPALALIRIVEIPGNLSVQVFINVVLASITVLYLKDGIGKGKQSRILLSIGSSLAILCLFWFFRSFYPDELEWAALVLGGNMLLGCIAGWSKRGCGFLAQLLFVKATFLIGVWGILHYAGDLRWMVLCLQTVVVAAAARRASVLAMELTVWAVALVSYLYFSSGLVTVPDAGSFVWWMMVLYPAVITLAMAWLLQPLDTPGFSIRDASRKWGYALVPVVAVCLWGSLFEQTSGREFEIASAFVYILYAGVAISLIPFFSRWMLLMVSALSFVLSSVHFCDKPFSVFILTALVMAGAGAVYILARKKGAWSEAGENVVYALTITPITLWMLQALNDWKGQAVLVLLLGAGIVLGGLIPKVRHIGSWAFLPLLVFMLTESAASGVGYLSIIAFAAGLLWLAVPVLVPRIKAGLGWAEKGSIWSVTGVFLFWIYALLFGDPEATWLSGQMVLGIIAMILLAGSFRWPVYGYLIGALLFIGTVAGRHVFSMMGEASYVPWKSEALISAGLLYAFSMLWFFLKPIPFPKRSPEENGKFRQISSGLAAVLFFGTSVVTFQYEALGWMDWYTPILAVTAFIMILLGLFRSDSVFRRLGLIALAFPLIRLFLIDVQDVLHRIIAFAAAAVLLTVLGYLYNRLASRMGESE